MKCYVYIIYSSKLNRYYTGIAMDLSQRLREHNTMHYKDAFTSRGIPWELKWQFECDSKKRALLYEAFIKKMKSKVFIEKLINDSQMALDIYHAKC